MKVGQDDAGRLVDLSDCDREPIHIPGRIQPHGALLSLSEPDLVARQVSGNAGRMLGLPPEGLLGRPVSDALAPGAVDALRSALAQADLRPINPIPLSFGGREFEGVAHRHAGALILELEPARPAGGVRAPVHSREMQQAMTRLQAAETLAEFCRIAAEQARALAGYDRVVVYRFDPDWNGEVIAEAGKPGLDPLLGLHFPASDIPEQARRLYALNPIRSIPDVDYEASPLVPEIDPATGRPLDLSFAGLRSVSPVHVEYLHNMGATASMSISLMRGDRLWGLISCLHYGGPRFLNYAERSACEFLGSLVSVQLAVKEDSQSSQYRGRLREVRERLLQRMSAEPDLVKALLADPDELLTLTGASGAAVVFDGSYAAAGATPEPHRVKALVAWLRTHVDGEVYHTDCLPRECPEAADLKGVAAGLLAVTTSRSSGHWVLWFRPEVVRTVDWGGDPRKPIESARPDGRLSPRKSFELWKEVVRLRSLPWRPAEVEAARLLRGAIVAVVVRRAEELTRLNAELQRSNTDLDAFAFSASHDLKEPLRGISNYATFLLEDYGGRLDEGGADKLHALVRLTRRMDDLIESLLRYSRLSREGPLHEPTDLNDVLRGALDSLEGRLEGASVEVRVPRPLPTVDCDRVQVGEVFSNLIANAVKYNDKPLRWVEVGYTEPTPSGGAAEPAPVFHVRDNGIGIPEKHRHAVFRLFKRLHGRDRYGGGTGVGLAIVKKIVERHGGSVWVESEPGGGSAFHFTLRG